MKTEMLIIDAHVHLYECFHLEHLFDQAFANFAAQAKRQGSEERFHGLLCLAEKEGQNIFETLLKPSLYGKRNISLDQWTVHPTVEPYLLKLERDNRRQLYLAGGRQLVSKEGMEVLSLATRKSIPEKLPFVEQVQRSVDVGSITVIPWACGKWFGNRGKILRSFLEENDKKNVFLGDNGGRTGWMPSGILRKYGAQKKPLVSGSDPLPLQGEEKRVGSYGVYADIPFQERNMHEWLSKYLCHAPQKFHSYGNLQTLYRFVRAQYLLRRKGKCLR